MKTIKLGLAIALVGAMSFTVGCGKSSTPPANVQHAATTAAVETKPAAPAKKDELEDLKPKTITRGADIGDTKPAATPAPAPNAPSATAAPAAPATPAPAGGEAKFAIEPNDDSTIEWIGYGGILGQMNGGFGVFKGTVATDTADLAKSQIELSIEMKTIFSNSGVLTTKLRNEDFFNTDKFTLAKFTSTGVAKDGDKYNVSGNLDILGAARNVTFPATMEIKNGKLHAQAEFLINRNDWGIVYKGTGDNFIKDDVLVKFNILCDPAK